MLEKAKGKSLFHLGCLGIFETTGTIEDNVNAMLSGDVLHSRLRNVCREILGIDNDGQTVNELRKKGFYEIIPGDVEYLDKVGIDKQFDIIFVGDLIEHLSQPGKVLEGIKRFMHDKSQLLITTPNSFGILHFIRYTLGKHSEGVSHVLSFNIFTLKNLLRRHGYRISEAYTCYVHPPKSFVKKIKYLIGIPFFQTFS